MRRGRLREVIASLAAEESEIVSGTSATGPDLPSQVGGGLVSAKLQFFYVGGTELSDVGPDSRLRCAGAHAGLPSLSRSSARDRVRFTFSSACLEPFDQATPRRRGIHQTKRCL